MRLIPTVRFSSLFLAQGNPYGWAEKPTTWLVSSEYSQSAQAKPRRGWPKPWSMFWDHDWKEGSLSSKEAIAFPLNESGSSKPPTLFLTMQDCWPLNGFGH